MPAAGFIKAMGHISAQIGELISMETKELQFHEIKMEDKSWMEEKLAEDDRMACEYSFANNFIWRKVYKAELAKLYGCVLIRFQERGKFVYSFPIGAGDKKAVIEQLLFLCQKKHEKLWMAPLVEEDRRNLLTWFPGRFLIEGDRDDYDYIYSTEKLSKLAGKKLHGKRNHIARFKDGDDWSYEPMTPENLEECRTMTYTWMHMRSEKWNEEMEEEVGVLHEAFDHMQELGLIGGVLRKKNEIVAFTMGERLNTDTFVVHFEKAYPDMQGAYPMINQQFVLHECQDYAYVNREEDTGDSGLRKAKLSYYPEILLEKYAAEESPVVFADPTLDREQIREIWKTCFGDDEEYIDFYLTNRMTKENMLVIHRNGKPVSMASFLPVEYCHDEMYSDARYVYAVATLPEYRRQGLAKQILQFAMDKFEAPLILAPAEESLCRYYEKMGFIRAFPGEEYSPLGGLEAMELRSAGENNMDTSEPVTPEEYLKIRDAKLKQEGYVRWDTAAIRYAMELNAYLGGKTYAVVTDNESTRMETEQELEKDILMFGRDGDSLIIEETTLNSERLKSLLPGLLEETGTKNAVYRKMEGMLWMPESAQSVGKVKNGYLNLTLG